MGMIIKKSIQKLIPGFPTVSDKYNVQGGILDPNLDTPEPGVLPGVALYTAGIGAAPGTYSPVGGSDTAFMGVLLGTNVKLATQYPAGPNYLAGFKAGEAINVMLEGYVAVLTNLDPARALPIQEGTPLYVSGSVFCTSAGTGAVEIPGGYFTGVAEVKEINGNRGVVAEVYIPAQKFFIE